MKSVTLGWSPPSDHAEDGVLQNYYVTCHEKNGDYTAIRKSVLYPSTVNSAIFSSLTPFTTYSCCVTPQWATNGAGPQKCVEGTTKEEGICNVMLGIHLLI